MTENNTNRMEQTIPDEEALNEGGLRPPPGLSFWRRSWWWFDFLILVKLARLRFIAILVVIGLLIVYWDTMAAYYDKWTRPASADRAVTSDVEYFCPMHPSVIRDNPKEKCPICFMPLSKRKKGEGKEESLPSGIVNRVQLSPYRVILAGIQTWTVEYVTLSKRITTVGFVEFNERGLKQVAARVKGRLDTLFVNETGQMVKAGEEMASLYSPDLVVTVQNLLDAQRNGNAQLLRSAKDRLTLWGIGEDQVNEILKTGKANTHLKIRSPIDGHVIKKYVKEGQYVDEGTSLYDVADLNTVWIQAQVYEDETVFLSQDAFHQHARDKQNGLAVTATTQATSAERIPGILTFVYPHVDQETRTLTVRFELDNPKHRLRPGTSATVEVQIPPGQVPLLAKMAEQAWGRDSAACGSISSLLATTGSRPEWALISLIAGAGRYAMLRRGLVLAVPEGAVIDTGSQQIVYREVSPGEYEGVKVELGPRMANSEGVLFYPVFSGLEWSDKIVTAGSFLVDAETRLNPAAGSIYFGGTGLNKPSSSSASSVRPSTPTDEDASVRANLAKLSKADQRLAEAQKYCPVLQDSRLGSMGQPIKVIVKGQPVFLCCKGCAEEARADPDKTLAIVEKLKTKVKERSSR